MFGWSTLRNTATSSCKESISSCFNSPFFEMHFTATLVPSLDVARMTLLKAPVPNSLSSRLYFLANSEFASARSPDPPALEPCVGCRVSALSVRGGGALNVYVRAFTPSSRRIMGTTPRRWRGSFTHLSRRHPGSRRARSLSIGVRARARSLQPSGPWAAARESPSARQAAPRPEQLETAAATHRPVLRAPAPLGSDAASYATAHRWLRRRLPVLVRHCTASPG